MTRPFAPSAGSSGDRPWRITVTFLKLAGLLVAVGLVIRAAQGVKTDARDLLELPSPPPKIDVVYAQWGVAGQFAEVTGELRQLCNDRPVCSERRDLAAWLGKDPNGLRRTLHIRFACGGASMPPVDVVEGVGSDGSAIDLRCN